MSFWDQLVQVGSTYVKHVGIIKQLGEAAPDQRIGVLSNYVRGLSDQSFAGFKVLLMNAFTEEKGAQARSVLESVIKNIDAVRSGQPVVATAAAAPAPVAAADTSGATATMSDDEAFLADAHFCNDHWWNQPNEEMKRTKLVDTLIRFDETRYQQFTGHLRRLRDNHVHNITVHEKDEINAWGTYFEDRMAYVNARERTGQRDPTWMKQMREMQSVLGDMDWLINACEEYWPIIQKQRQAVPRSAPVQPGASQGG